MRYYVLLVFHFCQTLAITLTTQTLVVHFCQPLATPKPLVFSLSHPFGCYSAPCFPNIHVLGNNSSLVFYYFLPLAIILPWTCIQQLRLHKLQILSSVSQAYLAKLPPAYLTMSPSRKIWHPLFWSS